MFQCDGHAPYSLTRVNNVLITSRRAIMFMMIVFFISEKQLRFYSKQSCTGCGNDTKDKISLPSQWICYANENQWTFSVRLHYMFGYNKFYSVLLRLEFKNWVKIVFVELRGSRDCSKIVVHVQNVCLFVKEKLI